MGGIENYFVRSAEAARSAFLAACQAAGVRVSTFASSKIGADLHLDAARFGSPDVRRNVVLCTGAGGPASLVASAIMTGCVREGLHRDLPRGLGLVLINGVSPDGPAWPSDQTATPRGRAEWNDALLSKADDRFAAFERSAEPRPATRAAGDAAQAPAWNRIVQQAVCTDLFTDSRELLFLDFRTGPGQVGDVEIQNGMAEDDRFAAAAQRWFADDWSGGSGPPHPSALSPPAGGLPAMVSAKSHVLLVEFGTYSMTTVIDAIALPAGAAAAAPDPVQDLRRMAFPEAPAWKRFVWQNASAIVATTMSRFAA